MSELGAAIRTTGLRKEYGSTTAVAGLDLEIQRGAVFGFLGPNGAGKTTTMRMLTTLTRPTSGDAWVAGDHVESPDSIRPKIGYLPEEPPVYEELSAVEQLEYVAGLRDLDDQRAHERIDELLSRFDLTADKDDRIGSYSKGMRQKVGISQALLHDPEVLFLDEPTSGLDPRSARTVRDTIADLADADTTVFLSTHILPVVDEIADTIGVLHDGELVAEGPPAALKQRAEGGEESTLEEVFLEVTQDRPEARPR